MRGWVGGQDAGTGHKVDTAQRPNGSKDVGWAALGAALRTAALCTAPGYP